MDVENISKISVIGAGIMGHGIAQIFAQSGYNVSLMARRKETLNQALKRIRSNLDLFVKHNLIRKDAIEDVLSRIETYISLEDAVKEADFVIEAVPEDINVREVKKGPLAKEYLVEITVDLSLIHI
mgnify:CR=1 FL=1